MLKKLSKMAMVLGLLAAAHFAYARGFDLVVARLRAAHAVREVDFAARDSAGKALVKRMAAESFGPDDWTGTDDAYTYLVQKKGIVLFAMNVVRPTERDGVKFDGKRIEVDPAAVILQSPKGGSRRTMTSKKAVIDFNKPFGLNLKADAEPLSVDRAVLEREVLVRDDRGTPDDPSDDMVIGPINEVVYDGVNQVIRSDSDIVLVDRGLRVTGTGLEIQLSTRAPEQGSKGGPGIEGAQKITLLKNVRATFIDVGGGNVLPDVVGGAKPVAGKVAKGEPVPLDVQCQGPLVVELPRKPSTPTVGPPEPSLPTTVEFRGNVVVRRGKLTELPDQIDCDTLHLTLLPGEPKAPEVETAPTTDVADAAPPAQGDRSAFGGLQLRRAKFSGHAVWVQSPAQGVKIRCVELLHYEDPAAGKKTTVLNGGGPKKLWVEKREVAAAGQADAGQVRTITHIWCNDATVTDQDGHIALVANGPGLLESRPGTAADAPPRDVPPARTAVWRDQLWLQDEAAAAGVEPGKVLVLKGAPRVEDRVGKSSLTADDFIIAYLNPPAKKPQKTADGRDVVPTAYVEPGPAAPPKQEIPDIRQLKALKNVHLVDASHDYGFRDLLVVDFVTGAITSSPAKPAPTAPMTTAPAPAPPAEGQPAPAASPDPAQAAPEKPLPPKTTTMADRAEAVVVVGPKPAAAGAAKADGESAYEVRDVVMRGGVRIHQDPAAGKVVGTDAKGELLELRGAGKGKATFDLYHHDPYSDKDRGLDPAKAPPAVVRNDEMTVVAETIQVDQELDLVRAFGRQGKLTMLVDRATFTDRAAGEPQAGEPREVVAEKKPGRRNGKDLSPKVPLTVTWADRMTFEGVAKDPLDRPAAKIKFYSKARAEMEDALLYGEEYLTLYTDRPVPLVDAGKLAPGPAPAADDGEQADEAEPRPKADLAMVEIKGTPKLKALVVSRKVHPELKTVLNAQRLEALSIIYDRASGMFKAPGPGEVRLYDRSNDGGPKTGFDATVAEGPGIRPVAYRPDGDGPADQVAANPDAPRRAGEQPKLAPLLLTQIQFQGEMRGRFGTGKAQDVDDQRWAEFKGAVETMRGEVKTERDFFHPDRLPFEVMTLSSDILRVINEPPPSGAAKTENGRTFLKAWDNVNIRAKQTALQADIVTYDSLNDLALAKGTEGRAVQILQQRGIGQPGSPGTADIVQLNPKTEALEVKGPGVWRLIDERTGIRPSNVNPTPAGSGGPARKPPKPFKPPTNPVERRGFSGSGR